MSVSAKRARFSIFDWLDESGRGMGQTYDERLKMLEYADRAGYYCYHLAEHHGSELSTTPSPNIFLSAVAQRTHRIRLGALTYLLPLYNPLRLLEEICMLDQLSGGRLEMGVSRGSSAFEGERFGVRREEARAMFEEALDIILMGLSSGVLDYHGQYFQYDRLTTRLRPYQRPYPPLWYRWPLRALAPSLASPSIRPLATPNSCWNATGTSMRRTAPTRTGGTDTSRTPTMASPCTSTSPRRMR